MKYALLVAAALSLGACKKTRVKQCDDLVALGEKIEKCEKIPADSRQSVTSGIASMKKALKTLEDVGDQAPQSQLDSLGRTCQMQVDRIQKMYEKVAPECLK